MSGLFFLLLGILITLVILSIGRKPPKKHDDRLTDGYRHYSAYYTQFARKEDEGKVNDRGSWKEKRESMRGVLFSVLAVLFLNPAFLLGVIILIIALSIGIRL